MSLKYVSVLFVFSLATFAMNLTVGHLLFTVSPQHAFIIGGCLVLRWLSSNTALTIIDEYMKKENK